MLLGILLHSVSLQMICRRKRKRKIQFLGEGKNEMEFDFV